MFPFSLIPFPWNFVAGAVAIAAVVGSVYLVKHNYDEGKRDEGRAEVQAKWDAANAAQKIREQKAADEADDFQRRADAKREADFKRILVARTAELQARLVAQSVSPDVTGELRNSVRAANQQGAGKSAEANPTPAGTTDGLALVKWFDDVAEKYRACRERVEGWVKWDDERVGGTP